MLCYNCFGTGHIAKNCPHSQEFSRCAICYCVVQVPTDHKENCTTKSFVSQRIGGRVFAMKTLFELEFRHTEDRFYILESNQSFGIGDTDQWVATPDIFVRNSDRERSLKFSVLRSMARNVVLLDKIGKKVASIVSDTAGNTIVVNGHYKLDSFGDVTYNYKSIGTVQNITPMCCIAVKNTDEAFKFRIRFNNTVFSFGVNSAGVILIDPFSSTFEKCGSEPATSPPVEISNEKNGADSNDIAANVSAETASVSIDVKREDNQSTKLNEGNELVNEATGGNTSNDVNANSSETNQNVDANNDTKTDDHLNKNRRPFDFQIQVVQNQRHAMIEKNVE